MTPMDKLMEYDAHWFFERQDKDGAWHTVADHLLLRAALRRKPGMDAETHNLQWQFVRSTILGYTAWAGERSDSFDRWPAQVSSTAARWLRQHQDQQAEIATFNTTVDLSSDIPITVPAFSFGNVGPCDGLAQRWAKPQALARFVERMERTQTALGILPVAHTRGWYTLDGRSLVVDGGTLPAHAVLATLAGAPTLQPAGVDTTRLLFATKR
jgi:hypothetical protein